MHKAYGFSLIQLLTALAIIAITTSLALPGYRTFTARNQAAAVVNEMLNQLRFARTEALAKGLYVSVCAIGEEDTCGEDWNKGVYVFNDPDADGEIDNAGDIIRIFSQGKMRGTLTMNGGLFNYINFTPMGTGLRKHISGNIVYCPVPGDATLGRVIIFHKSGRAYLGQDSNDNGILETGSEPPSDIEC